MALASLSMYSLTSPLAESGIVSSLLRGAPRRYIVPSRDSKSFWKFSGSWAVTLTLM